MAPPSAPCESLTATPTPLTGTPHTLQSLCSSCLPRICFIITLSVARSSARSPIDYTHTHVTGQSDPKPIHLSVSFQAWVVSFVRAVGLNELWRVVELRKPNGLTPLRDETSNKRQIKTNIPLSLPLSLSISLSTPLI